MKKKLMQYLACPSCVGDLKLSEGKTEGVEILDGELECEAHFRIS